MKKMLKILSMILSVLIIMNIFAVANPVLAVEVQEAVAELEAESSTEALTKADPTTSPEADSTTEAQSEAITEPVEETEGTTAIEELFEEIFAVEDETEADSTEAETAHPEEIIIDEAVSDEIASETELENEILSQEPEIADEIVSLRDEYTKYFRRTDGTYIAAKYATPVHFLKDGKWVEYDFTLTQKQTARQLNTADSVLVPSRTDIPVHFPSQLSSDGNNEIRIGVADTVISFAPKSGENNLKTAKGDIATDGELISTAVEKQEGTSTYALRKNDATEEKKNAELKVAGQKSSLKYEEIFDNVSLEYELTSNVLKESIVLNKKQSKNTFEFTMDLGGLFPKKEADGSIVLYADEEYTQPKSQIMAPYMLDSAGEYSDAVTMEITPDGDKYTLTVTADKKWLNDKEREYPVIIDPTIRLDVSRADTIDCYVDNSEPSSSFPLDYFLYAGHSTLGKTRTFIKFDLPALPDDCAVIQNASLNFYQLHVDAGSDKRFITVHKVTEDWNNSTNKPTWNNQPSFDSTVLDYAELTYDVGDYYSFDITRLAKEWFEGGTNYGICLKGYDESLVGRVRIISAEYNSSEDIYPAVTVTYRNNKGIEGYWSYSGFSAGAAGSASVNDYTGNLVYQIPLTSTVSERMPVSLSLIYNSYDAGDKYTCGKDGSFKTTPGKGWRLNIQETILPSSEYGLSGKNAERYPYVYTDGDGTEHYIQKVTKKDKNDNEVTTYEDEDGLGLTFEKITDGTATYKLKDKMDNVRLFNSKGNLFKISDANLNNILITYDDTKTKITKIMDGSGHTLEFEYYTNSDHVKTIKDNANRVITLNISGNKLNSISHFNGTTVYVVYETSSGYTDYINYVQSSDGNGLNFNYTTKDKGVQVIQVREFSADPGSISTHVGGQLVTFDRTKYNTTVIRSAGIDGIHKEQNTENRYDDIVTVLQFDNSGRPVSQQVSYNGAEIGAGAYNYTSATNTSDSKNKIADAASLGKNTVNMLTNGTCESHDGWVKNTNIDADHSDHYIVTGIQYAGKNCIAVRNIAPITTAVNTNYGQTVTGWVAGKTYTLSAFVRTLNLTQLNKGGLEGAYLQITATGSTDTDIVYSQVLTSDTDTTVNNGWRRLSTTITLDSDTTKVTAYLCLRNATGNAYFDNAQLELGSTPNSVNLLDNSSFEKIKSDNTPSYWAKTGTTSSDIPVTSAYKEGSRALKINGHVNTAKTYYQTIDVQSNPADTYIVSGWAKANAVSSNYHSHYTNKGAKITDEKASEIFESVSEEDDKDVKSVEDSKFEIDVSVIYKDQDGNTKTQHKASAKFNTAINDWQYSSAPVVLKYSYDKYSSDDDNKTYTPYQLKVSLVYTNQANYALFDHIQLVKDVAQSYTYDDEGNIVSVSANAEQKNDMTYDPDSNDLKTYKDAVGNTTTFEYDEKHNVTKVTSPKGVKTQYTYSSVGLNTATETVNTDGAVKIKTSKGHTENYTGSGYSIYGGAYVDETFDQHGYKTTYGYDMPTGVVTSVTSPNGLVTTKAYDNSKSKLTKVSAQNTSVVYTYDNNRLKKISFGYGTANSYNEEYNFEYDVYGNVLTTRVGENALSTNTYGSYNGALEKTAYENGDNIRYAYTYSGLTSAIYHDNDGTSANPAFTWLYSSNGTPRAHKDGYAGLKYDYSYDAIGRLIRTDISKTSNGSAVASTEYGYNTRGHLTSITNEIGGNAYGQYYSYSDTGVSGALANAKDGLPTRYKTLGTNTDYSYDSLNRLRTKSVKVSDSLSLNNTYTYKDSLRGSGYTTTQLATETVVGVEYGYNYDNMGNITSITRGGSAYREYMYDSLGQLTQERNLSTNTMTSYTYNHLGNITVKNIDDANGINEKGIVRYGYSADSNAGWKYLLTSITTEDYTKGTTTTETIDYDAIGNPLSYRGASMSWFGRQLRTYSKGSTTASFTYDADGLRSSKTVNGTKTEYQYVGDQLFYEDRGNGNKLYYFYDSYGNLTRIYHHNNGTKAAYYVATNAQGDVVALYNASGKKVGAYDYDAWGNQRVFVVTQDSNGANVHTQINPETQYLNHIVNLNPFRYRGYFYDRDLGLYYLQSRYYDASIGRFINADGYITTGQGVLSHNMYAYCGNNPVMYSDPSGKCIHNPPFGYSDPSCVYCNPIVYPSNGLEFYFGLNRPKPQQQITPTSSNFCSNNTSALIESAGIYNDAASAIAESSNITITQNSSPLIVPDNTYIQKTSSVISCGLIVADVAYGMYCNYIHDASGRKIAWDAFVDIGVNVSGVYMSSVISAGTCALALSAFPVIGTATGLVIGAMAGMVYGLCWSYYTEPVSDKVKGMVK